MFKPRISRIAQDQIRFHHFATGSTSMSRAFSTACSRASRTTSADCAYSFLAALRARGEQRADFIERILKRLPLRLRLDEARHQSDGEADPERRQDRGHRVGADAVVRFAQQILRTVFGVLRVHNWECASAQAHGFCFFSNSS